MSTFRHSIRQQTLDIEVDDEETALKLQPRIGDINRQRLLPTIERVLDEFAVAGRHVRIGRLDVDLGDLPLGEFEQAAEAALETALRRALEAAVREATERPTPDDFARSEGAARLATIEHYLLHGTLPFSAQAQDFSAETMLLGLAADDAAALAGMIGRHARDRRVVERLVLQLGAAALEALLRSFAPEHAALILAYMLDLRHIHRTAPLLSLAEEPFARLLWVLALSYVLTEPGSQFNRKSFVRALLEGLAEQDRLDYRDLIETLRRGLRATQRRRPLASSLPAIVAELVRDLARDAPPPDADAGDTARPGGDRPAGATGGPAAGSRLDLLAQWLRHGHAPTGPADQLIEEMLADDPAALAEVLRRNARHERALQRLADTIAERLLQRLLAVLEPEHAALIIAYMLDLRELNRIETLLRLADEQLARLLWILTLSYLLLDPGTQFNRKSFVRALIAGMAEREALEFPDLARALQRGLRRARARRASHTSLLAIIDELTRDLDAAADRAEAGRETAVDGRAQRSPSATLPSGADDGWDAEVRPASAASADPGLAAELYERIENLRHYLRRGVLPWAALLRNPRLTLADTLADMHAVLADLSSAQLRDLFAAPGHARRQGVERALSALPERAMLELALRLAPPALGGSAAFRDALASFAEAAPDRRAFFVRVILLLLDGADIDLEQAAADAGAAPSPSPDFPEEPEAWETAADLKSLLASRLRFGAAFRPDLPPVDRILATLAARHPDEARQFLDAVGDTPELQAALARQVSPAVLRTVLRATHPAQAAAIEAVIAALATLPRSQARISDAVEPALFLDAVSRLSRGPATDAFAWLLRRIGTAPVGAEARAHLLQQFRVPSCAIALPATLVSAFEAAIEAVLARAGDTPSAADDGARGDDRAAAVAPAWRDLVLAWLAGTPAVVDTTQAPDAHTGQPTDDHLLYALHRVLEHDPDGIVDAVRQHGADPRRRERWAATLPDSALAGISAALEPRRHRALLAAAEILIAAWREVAPAGRQPAADRALLWSVLLALLLDDRVVDRTPARLVAAFFARTVGTDRDLAAPLIDAVGRHAGAAGDAGLVALLARDRAILLAAAGAVPASPHTTARAPASRPRPSEPRPPRRAPDRGRTAFGLRSDEEKMERDPIYIANAGLVLTGPFLPMLFTRLDLVERDADGRLRLRGGEAPSRAVHLLQYLVDARTDAPEPLLVLNKLLCGLPVGAPIVRAIEPSDNERSVCDSLLRSMISNWTSISGTSVAGLRETFLRREGKITRGDDGWKLTVQRKTVDVLVDQIPWGIALIYHAWMPDAVHVTW